MKFNYLFILILFQFGFIHAQVPKTSIVEHFTNSNCSICASNNPTIYSVLNNHPSVLHITFHPSSPYPSCVFSIQNPAANDARTNFYGVYGGTPKLIVNGGLVSTANLNTSLTSISSDMSNYAINTTQEFLLSDSVLIKLVIKKVGADTLSTARLSVFAKQDSIFQLTGNGESLHHDVFRKSISSITGDSINLPLNVNDSIVLTYSFKIENSWVASRVQTIAILQESNSPNVINADESYNIISTPLNVVSHMNIQNQVYPNPVNNQLNLTQSSTWNSFKIYTMSGREIISGHLFHPTINTTSLANGVYLIQLISDKKVSTSLFSVNHP